jgi:RNA polymerase sigma-70 factor (ECF subfamily)
LLHTIRKCIEQDKLHQRKFYERYFGFAVKIAFRYVTDFDKARDIVHDSFIKIFKNLPQFLGNAGAYDNPEFSLLSWIKKIVLNTSIDYLRRNKQVQKVLELTEEIWDYQNETISADAHVLYKELLVELSRLSPTYRVVFSLHAIEGYTHTEIGEMLGITTGGAKSIYFKAKMHLQKKINGPVNNKLSYVKP